MSRSRWKARPLLLHPLRVALGQVFVGEALEAVGRFSLVAVRRIVASDKLIEVGALERIFFEGEVFVDAQIVNPEMSAIAICQDLLTDPQFISREQLEKIRVGWTCRADNFACGLDSPCAR